MSNNRKTKYYVHRLTTEDRRRCWRRLDQLLQLRRQLQLVAAKAGQ